MINSLDSSNPTQLLLDAIRLAGIDMLSPTGSFNNNEEFLLGLVFPTGEVQNVFCSMGEEETHKFSASWIDISHIQNNCRWSLKTQRESLSWRRYSTSRRLNCWSKLFVFTPFPFTNLPFYSSSIVRLQLLYNFLIRFSIVPRRLDLILNSSRKKPLPFSLFQNPFLTHLKISTLSKKRTQQQLRLSSHKFSFRLLSMVLYNLVSLSRNIPLIRQRCPRMSPSLSRVFQIINKMDCKNRKVHGNPPFLVV